MTVISEVLLDQFSLFIFLTQVLDVQMTNQKRKVQKLNYLNSYNKYKVCRKNKFYY